MTRISIIVPVYNEEKVVNDTLEHIKQVISEFPEGIEGEIIAVNDGSRDKSGEVLKSVDGINVITNPYNLGYGASLKRGIREATGEWIAIVDADGTYPIEDFTKFIPFLDNYTMIIGERLIEDDQTSWLRRFGKRWLNRVASFLVRFPIKDVNSGMRIFKKELCMEFFNLYPHNFSFTTTITIAFIRSHYPIRYVPINYAKRVGASSIVPTDFFRFLAVVIRIVFYFHPWRFLGPLAVIAFGAGIVKGGIDLYLYNSVGNFSELLVVFSVLTVIFALLADLLFKQRR